MTADSHPALDEPIAAASRAPARDPRRERVKASQDVAAAVAHELRTPVFGIASAAQLLRYRVADDPVVQKNIGRILRDAERLNVLVAALLEYARPTPIRLLPGDPDTAWTHAFAAQRGVLESKALLVRHASAEPRASCSVDAEQLTQACSNLLANAIDAAPEGSDLVVESHTLDDGRWQSRLHNDGAPVSDEVMSRAFDPFVTTKAGHAGIGLAVAHRIVVEHGGTIDIESSTGGGTTLTLTLPPARHG
ncbi:MAG TPA: HAMP domain-containing sensor histidine kinase [Gemmatimonadaceae bacterium]|nr:HAMP domain-containing sensor histidine kinase [Gemmatimonadaceae bacterium]